jgi:hypothetical protein
MSLVGSPLVRRSMPVGPPDVRLTVILPLPAGGSTIVCLFERGKLRWDEDILDNSSQAIETLVRMGMGVGRVANEN